MHWFGALDADTALWECEGKLTCGGSDELYEFYWTG
jgi:hypothetical protein